MLSDDEVEAVATFRMALRKFEQRTAVLVRSCGLTPQRYVLLLAVRSGGNPTVSAIAAALDMPQTTVTDLITRAAEIGLVRKTVAEHDRRVVECSLTAEGERRLTCAVRALAEERAALAQALDEAAQLHPA